MAVIIDKVTIKAIVLYKYLLVSLLFISLTVTAAPKYVDISLAKHVLGRVAFSVSVDELPKYTQQPYNQFIQGLLSQSNTNPITPPPSWTKDALLRVNKSMSQEQKKTVRKKLREQSGELKTWWYREMIQTANPVNEWMTLFWHNHFTSSLQKVKSPLLLYKQNELLRQHAMGNFAVLLQAIAKDPAMLVYLDNRSNRKKKPNENFARELLELFTLGEGHYTESDIKAAAKAFTGWGISKNAEFVFKKKQHDNSVKTFMGRSGNLDGDDIINVLLSDPQTALFLTEKLWRALVSDDINSAATKKESHRLANVLRQASYEIKPWLLAMLNSAGFLDEKNRGSLIKSPVDFLVGFFKQFSLPLNDANILPKASKQIGQDIFDPPNVKGWPGGKNWITSNTLLLRQQYLNRGLRAMEKSSEKMRSKNINMMNAADQDIKKISYDDLQALLLPILESNNREIIATQQDWLRATRKIVLQPAYQLK